ncbi:endopeptidase La [Lentisalinibacter orientalis]|uniref:endopeptidase La n=1 Tax=Lentisalinibacter orientalis TaxID=2992241 RepID=UPI0038653D1B
MNERNQQTEPRAEEETTESRVPEDVLLVLPVRNLIVFPGAVTQVALGREISIAAAQEAVKNDRKLGLVLQRDPAVDEPGPEDLYQVGTVVSVVRYITAPNGMHHLICQGEERFRALDFVPGLPFMAARYDTIPEPKGTSPEAEALANHVKQKAGELIQLLPQVPPELPTALASIESPGLLADLVAGLIDIKPAEKQFILETVEVRERLERLAEFLTHRLKVLKLSKEIDEQTQDKIDERQREYLLREQLKTIQKELGEDEGAPEAEEIERAIDEAGMPPEAEKQARKELKRLKAMPEAAAEHSMIRTYLDWLTSVPWSKEDEENIDIARARDILDEDHYGLDKVKRRILEYLAVRKLNPTGRSPILCFVGPPGVGKTSLGQSIARALGLEFVRASLGGVHDEAEIRGHRRTYIGSMPGSVVQSIVKAGTRNPVFMLDEMDKLGVGFHGDPSSALLEVLDPEQNSTFKDHYLDVPFDLSKVLFVGTANVLDNIPGPLRDRMEVIELPGYTQEEKLEIARRYLVGRQLEANGLKAEQAAIDDDAIEKLIDGYTREAGVRNLERQIGAVLRHAAMQITEGTADSVHVTADDLQSILGAPKFESEVALRTSVPGVATGLAWTPVGGDILFIEASRIPGQGKLILTGQLGDVMKESAQAALSLNKSRANRLDAAVKEFEENDIHIHVPAGAIPKDGPSAGVAMFVALASLLSGRNVRKDVAMTGEISLRGLVLPVGGIKEKVLAALRAGINTVLLPARNRKDLEDVPESAREQLEFIWLENVDQALEAALEPEGAEDKPQAA